MTPDTSRRSATHPHGWGPGDRRVVAGSPAGRWIASREVVDGWVLSSRTRSGTSSSCCGADPRDERGRVPPRTGISGSRGRCTRLASRCATACREQYRPPEWRGVSRWIAARAAHAAPGRKLESRLPWKASQALHCSSRRGPRGYSSASSTSMYGVFGTGGDTEAGHIMTRWIATSSGSPRSKPCATTSGH